MEIGCGDGRLTWRYADRAAHVTAIDPFEDSIERAKAAPATDLPIEFRQVAFEEFAAVSDANAFDVVLLSWSLCCMEHEGMVHALEQILHRILRTEGILLDIHPVPEPSVVQVRDGDEVLYSELDPDDGDDDLHHAEAALATVVGRGLQVIGRSRDVDFLTHAASSSELRTYLASAGAAYDPTPKNPMLVARRDELCRRVDEGPARSSGSAEVVYNEPARMSRLVPAR